MLRCLLTTLIVAGLGATASAQPDIPAPVGYRFSLDLGSDWDLSDPTNGEANQMDCGDIYLERPLQQPPNVPPPLVKDDDSQDVGPNLGYPFDPAQGGAPQPVEIPNQTPQLVGTAPQDTPQDQVLGVYSEYWDLDASDQIGLDLPMLPTTLVELPPTPRSLASMGVHVEPEWIAASWDDDGPPGWYINQAGAAGFVADIPTMVPPHHGHYSTFDNQEDHEEVVEAVGAFGTWMSSPVGTRVESQIGVPLMNSGFHHDDDIDALDVEDHRYWYFSPDHEANLQLDPGSIFMTDLNFVGANYVPMFDQAGNIGLLDDPLTPDITEDADVDAWEFCALRRETMLQMFDLSPDLLTGEV